MDAINGMRRRIFKSLEGLVKWTTKSLKNPTYQFIIGAVIVVYTAFLEKDTESVLSLAMRNPLGRLGVLAVLSLLAVSSPALAILFAVLVVMSAVGKSTEGFWADPNGGCGGGEGFENAKKSGEGDEKGHMEGEEKKSGDGEEKKSGEDEEKKPVETNVHPEDKQSGGGGKGEPGVPPSTLQSITSNLQSMMASATSSTKALKEGFFGNEPAVSHDLVGGYDKGKNRFHSL
jgi:hypothetical protein